MTSSHGDDQLIRATLQGDEGAFAELVRRHQTRVFKLVYRYARDSSEADDLAQETFVRAYFSLSRYRFRAPFQHWLSRIATRVALDHLRRRYRRRELCFTDLLSLPGDSLEFLRAETGDKKVEDPLVQRELAEILEGVLSRLAPKEQLLIKARELEGQTLNEIAEMTGWSLPSIKVGLFRARKKMRKILNRTAPVEER